MDNELFELCKEVYERLPMWDSTEKCYAFIDQFNQGEKHWRIIPLHEENVDDVDEWHPLYTSDYLLEKLPLSLFEQPDFEQNFILEMTSKNWWGAGYPYILVQNADTPLKALLKLTLALHEAGELK